MEFLEWLRSVYLSALGARLANDIDSIFSQAAASAVDFGASSLAAIKQDLDEILALQTSGAPQALLVS